MTTRRTAVVEMAWKANIDDIVKKTAQRQGLNERETAHLVKQLKKRTSIADREAKKRAKNNERSLKRQRDQEKRAISKINADRLGAVRKLGEAAQGSLGATSSRIISLFEGISQLIGATGPVGLAVLAFGALAIAGVAAFAAVGLGAAALGMFMVRTVLNADELIEKFDKLKRFDKNGLLAVDPAALASIEQANDAWAAVGLQMDVLRVQLAEQLAPGVARVLLLLADLGVLTLDWFDGWTEGRGVIKAALTEIYRGILNFIMAPLALSSAVADSLILAFQAVGMLSGKEANKVKQVKGWVRDLADVMTTVTMAYGESALKAAELSSENEGLRDKTEKWLALIKGIQKPLKDQKGQVDTLGRSIDALTKSTTTAMSAFTDFTDKFSREAAGPFEQLAMDAQKDQAKFVNLAVELFNKRRALQEALTQASKAGMDERVALIRAQIGSVTRLIEESDASAEAMEAAHLQRRTDLQDKHRADRASKDAAQDKIDEANMARRVQAQYAVANAGISAGNSLAQVAKNRADSMQEGSEAQIRAARTAYAISKTVAIADVTVKTAQAVMAALASAPPPFNIPPAAAMAVAGAAQLAAVMSAPQPTFHTGGAIGAGGAPDEVTIRARSGEGVLTPRGMQMAGGSAGLAAMNRGGAQAPELVVIQKYQHRAFSAFTADHVKLTNSPIRRAIKGQRKVGHRDT